MKTIELTTGYGGELELLLEIVGDALDEMEEKGGSTPSSALYSLSVKLGLLKRAFPDNES
jgi:hypothetical protein